LRGAVVVLIPDGDRRRAVVNGEHDGLPREKKNLPSSRQRRRSQTMPTSFGPDRSRDRREEGEAGANQVERPQRARVTGPGRGRRVSAIHAGSLRARTWPLPLYQRPRAGEVTRRGPFATALPHACRDLSRAAPFRHFARTDRVRPAITLKRCAQPRTHGTTIARKNAGSRTPPRGWLGVTCRNRRVHPWPGFPRSAFRAGGSRSSSH
jgi:hypothetical protein